MTFRKPVEASEARRIPVRKSPEKCPELSSPAVFFKFAVPILFVCILLTGCQSAIDNRRQVAAAERQRSVQKLFETATDICKLDILEIEGAAVLSANAPRDRSATYRKEVEMLSRRSAEIYFKSLTSIKKQYPRHDVEKEILNTHGSSQNPAQILMIGPVISNHLNKVYLGLPISPQDVSQDFQSLRYGRSLR